MNPVVRPRPLLLALGALLLLAFWLSLALGPVSLPLGDTLLAALRLLGVPVGGAELQQAELILGQIRLPRSLLGLCVGAVLALSGWSRRSSTASVAATGRPTSPPCCWPAWR